ncbi:hypothetical protein [Archangium violaceum]|uniref:hypothetical protein n=1 Tax=Archangium violaceum TaxID=83451 RepID=UPI0037C08C58
MRRFPLRTLLLMTLALVAFVRLYILTHSSGRSVWPPVPSRTEPGVVNVAPQSPEAGTPSPPQACRTLDRTLEGAVRTPEDASALAKAREQLDACPQPPARACELGAALEARSPLDAGTSPLRELLDALCQRCPAGTNPCAAHVTRAVMGLSAGRPADLASVRWNLEHAGPGMPAACAELSRSLLAPSALASNPLPAPQRELLAQLAPACARAGQLPANVLHAAVVQGDVPALAQLVQQMPAGTSTVLKPSRTVGPQGGEQAFDGQEATGVELAPAASPSSRWEKDGALSAVFEPPVQGLSALRVRASGPGTLRAAIRTSDELGLNDPDSKTSFVLPVACRFRGTGQWETCTLPTPLLDVEALSVFPDKGKLTLNEVEARGTR